MYPQYIPQFLIPAFKSHIEVLVTFYTDMARRTLEAAQSLSELNMQLARDLIAEAGANSQRLMASKDASQLGSAISAHLTPGSNALRNYLQHLAEVMSRTNSSMAQTAATHMPEVRRTATTLTEEFMHEAKEQAARAREKMAQFHPGSQLRH
jgi:phasin family protein